jgi:hypothetical protein
VVKGQSVRDADDDRPVIVELHLFPEPRLPPGHMNWNPARSMIIASGCFRFSTEPSTRRGVTPVKLASSTPSRITYCRIPSRVCATVSHGIDEHWAGE